MFFLRRCYLVPGASVRQNCGIKITAMTPQKIFRISLPALLFLAFLLSPLRSKENLSSNGKRTFSIHLQADGESSSDHAIQFDFSLPVNNKKQKDTDHNNPDLLRHKRHADEDRHELHHHHFDKSKSRKKIINMLTGLLLKIIIVVSYFSILLCSYVSLSH